MADVALGEDAIRGAVEIPLVLEAPGTLGVDAKADGEAELAQPGPRGPARPRFAAPTQ